MDQCLTHAGHSRLGMSIFFRHAKIDFYFEICKLLFFIPFDVGEQLRALEPGRRACVCCISVTLWTVAHKALLSRGFFQGRVLEWVAISSSRGSSRPRGQTHIFCISCTDRQILCHCTTGEALGTRQIWLHVPTCLLLSYNRGHYLVRPPDPQPFLVLK